MATSPGTARDPGAQNPAYGRLTVTTQLRPTPLKTPHSTPQLARRPPVTQDKRVLVSALTGRCSS